jgi:dienelactone hydrolase
MATVALFPSVLGVQGGIVDAVDRFRAAGHEVLTVDLLGGRTFDDYATASAFAEGEIGHPTLMERASAAVAGLPGDLVVVGFSLGCVAAVHVATTRPSSGVVMIAGAIPPSAFDDGRNWPRAVPAQTHSARHDPYREEEMIELLSREVAEAGGVLETFDYPGDGHLFMDPSRAEEFDAVSSDLLWSRVLTFVAARG